MKNIKFRTAHYTFKNEFSHFSYWGQVDHQGNFSDDCFASPSSSNGTTRTYEEQYTGRLDKNGKEIYEGDIVNADGTIAEVIYSERWCEFKIVAANSVGYYDSIEVVGNIHE